MRKRAFSLVALGAVVGMAVTLVAPSLVSAIITPRLAAATITATVPGAQPGTVPEVMPGTVVTVQASGFESSQALAITLDGVVVANATTGSKGKATVKFTVPSTLASGYRTHVLFASTAKQGASFALTSGSDWPDTNNRGMANNAPNPWVGVGQAASLVKKWDVLTGAYSLTVPVVVDGLVYVGGTDNPDGTSGSLYARDATTGAARWTFAAGTGVNAVTVVNGVAYLAGVNGDVRALDALSGAVLWTSQILGLHHQVDQLEVANGILYVGSMHFRGGDDFRVTALNAATGTQIWQDADVGGWIDVGNGGSVVYVTGGRPRTIRALNAADGSLIWTTDAGGTYDARPVLADGVVYTCGWAPNGAGVLTAVAAATGHQKWMSSVGTGYCMSPVVTSGVVYFQAEGSTVYALDRSTGVPIWATGNVSSGSLALANGVLYAGSWSGTTGVRALDAGSGAPLANLPALGGGQPMVANGYVYNGGAGSGDLTAYGL